MRSRRSKQAKHLSTSTPLNALALTELTQSRKRKAPGNKRTECKQTEETPSPSASAAVGVAVPLAVAR